MKRVLLFRLMATLLIAITIPLAAKGEYISYTASYNLTQYMATDTLGGVTYSIVNYGDLENGGEPGKPLLPIDYLKFSVPYNATNFSVTTTLGSSITYLIDHMMYPVQAPRMMNDTTPVVITPPDSAAYFSGQFYPTQKAWVVDEGFLAGENHIVTVAVMPFAYQHTSTQDKLKKYKKVTVRLNYVIPDSLEKYPLIRRDTASRNEGYNLAKTLVVNPNDVINNAPTFTSLNNLNPLFTGSIPIPPNIVDSINNSLTNGTYSNLYPNYDYMIITPDSLKTSLKRIAEFKRQKGYHVGIVTVEEIICQNTSRPWYHNIKTNQMNDSARIIREYLKYAYHIGKAKYILLAGKDVPFKYGWSKTIPTDQYYIDLTTDWENSNFESFPELFVGRIIAKKHEQIKNYTEKLLRYELNPGNGNFSYLKRALYTNGYDQNLGAGATYTEIIRQQADSIFPNAIVMAEDRNTNYPTGTDVVNQINAVQYGFVSFNNHGIPLGIVTYGKGGPAPHSYRWLWAIEDQHAPDSITSHVNDDTSTGNGLNNMTNKSYPSICFSTACDVMPFDVKPGYDRNSINFGESFTTGKDYGGPAFLGNTRKAGHEAALMERKILKIIKEDSKLGPALALAKAHTPSNVHNLLHNLLGDPEFDVWTDLPQYYSNVNVTRTSHSMTISGIDCDSTIIAYYDNDRIQYVDTISTTSVILNGISPNSSVMLYKHNHIPYIVPLELQNITLENSQYVIASEVTAGYSVNTNRTSGDVIVPEGVEYEIEASGKVTLEDGFSVEKGATFAIYPACF